jgi:hypothetical protein
MESDELSFLARAKEDVSKVTTYYVEKLQYINMCKRSIWFETIP